LIAFAAVLGFVVIWCVTLSLVARFSGWGKLAELYPAAEPPAGRVFRWQAGRIGWSDYNGCLTITVGPAGLGLAVLGLFRPGHPPLLIPWSSLRVVQVHTGWLVRGVTVAVDDPPVTKMRLPAKVFDAAHEFRPTAAP
jgi:hypothetical protein